MIFLELDRETKALCDELKQSLRKEVQEKHYGDGSLYNSIDCKLVKQGDDEIIIQMTSAYYIKFLDGKQFYKRWIETNKPKIKEAVMRGAMRDVLNQIKKIK